jgi:hypothetical protein
MRTWITLGCLVLANCGPKAAADDAGAEGSSGSNATEGASAGTGGATGGDVTGGVGDTEIGDVGSGGGPGSGDPPTDPTTGSWWDTDEPPADTEWPDDTEGPDEAIACAGSTWVAMTPAQGDVQWALLDGRGHVRISDYRSEVTEVDAAGNVVGSVKIASQADNIDLGGADAAHAFYVAVDTQAGGRGVRKFDVNGVHLWDADLGPAGSEETWIAALAVAPNGSSVVSENAWDGDDATRLVMHDANGVKIWEEVLPTKTRVIALDSQGRMGAYGFNNSGGELRGLAADATELWAHDRWVLDGVWGGFDSSGALLFGAPNLPDDVAVARYEAGGVAAWDKQFDPTNGETEGVYHFASNAAGESVVGLKSYLDNSERVYVVKLDANGEAVAMHGCGPTLWGQDVKVAIDDAGAVYLMASGWSGDTAVHVVAKFG